MAHRRGARRADRARLRGSTTGTDGSRSTSSTPPPRSWSPSRCSCRAATSSPPRWCAACSTPAVRRCAGRHPHASSRRAPRSASRCRSPAPASPRSPSPATPTRSTRTTAERMLAQLVWTLRQEPRIRAVQLTIGGRPISCPAAPRRSASTSASAYDPNGVPATSDLFALDRGRVVSGAIGALPATLGPLGQQDGSASARSASASTASRVAGGHRRRHGACSSRRPRRPTGRRRPWSPGPSTCAARAGTTATASGCSTATAAGARVIRRRRSAPREVAVPGLTGRDVTELLVSRDGSRAGRRRARPQGGPCRRQPDPARRGRRACSAFTRPRSLPGPPRATRGSATSAGARRPTVSVLQRHHTTSSPRCARSRSTGSRASSRPAAPRPLRGRIRTLVRPPVDGASRRTPWPAARSIDLTAPRALGARPAARTDLADLRRLSPPQAAARRLPPCAPVLLAWPGARRGPRPVPRQPVRRVRRARAGCSARPAAAACPAGRGVGVAHARARRAGDARGPRRRTTARCGRWWSGTRTAASGATGGSLGDLLAGAVRGAAAGLDPAVPLLLVPGAVAPGCRPPARLRRRPRRSCGRGRVLRASRATPRRVAPLLVSRGGVADQAGLDARGPGAPTWPARCTVPPPALARRRPPVARAHVVVCDDVLTTGATAREAQRALEAVGPAAVGDRRGGRHPAARGPGEPIRRVTPVGPSRRGASVLSWSPSGSVVASRRGLRAAPRCARRPGKPMPVAGETVHVRPRAPRLARAGRSRCGLAVSPASAPASDAPDAGRRPVVAEKLRTPQQAVVGSKTRSAGRTPSHPAPADVAAAHGRVRTAR